jgi:hypothetical protein
LYVYNNYYHGNPGGNSTAAFFLEGGSCNWTGTSGTAYFWNNVFTTTGNIPGLGFISISSGTGHKILNNVLIGPKGANNCLGWNGANVTLENNIVEGCSQIIAAGASGATFATIDYNTYADSASGNPIFQVGTASVNGTSFASWQKACGCDAHSTYTSGPLQNLSATGVPSAGFIGSGAAINLTAWATGSMASLADSTTAGDSLAGLPRLPIPNAWDVGAYALGTATAGPAAPTSLVATVN